MWIDNLTTAPEKLPLQDMLNNSLFYPASWFDGGVVKQYAKEIQSFIYCDYGATEEEFLNRKDTFKGYKPLFDRSVSKAELIPNGWQPILPHQLAQNYSKYRHYIKPPFAHWVVYERQPDYSDQHGPHRFSLLYIGGEGVATYQALYWSNQTAAHGLAIIQPGTGFGWNWTDFRKRESALAWVVNENPYGQPKFILYGGEGNSGYRDLNWPEYQLTDRHYAYSLTGRVTHWERRTNL